MRLLLAETARAAHRLWKQPRFAAIGILTIAAATAPSLLFRLVDHAVLPPLPFEHAQELVHVWQRVPYQRATSYPKLRWLAEHAQTMDVAAVTGGTLFLERNGSSQRLATKAVTPSFFTVLGTPPLLGRTFREDEGRRPLKDAVVILSESVWRKQFDARPDIVGAEIRLSGHAFSVVGVMPATFHEFWAGAIEARDAWVPATMAPLGEGTREWRETTLAIDSPGATIWLGVGRLRVGHDLASARAEAALLGREAKRLWPESYEVRDGSIEPFDVVRMSEDAVDPKILHAVSALRVAGVLVLALGGLNLGSLLVARATARAKALAVHALLGASRLVLVWGVLCEAVFLGLLGGPAAVLLTRGVLRLLALGEPTILTAPFGVTFDPAGWRFGGEAIVVGFGLAVTVAVTFGLIPAIRATRADSAPLWRSGAGVRGGGLRQLRLTRPRGVLIAIEFALALALTVPALLVVRSLGGLVTADLGFRPSGVVSAPLELPSVTYAAEAVPVFVDDVTDRLKSIPGVESASWVSCIPIECGFFTSAVASDRSPESGFVASVHVVAPNAFRTLGIPVRQGRDFTSADRPDGARVAIVSEHAARLLGGATIGSRISAEGAHGVEVVAIVGDVPYRDLAGEPMPAVYFPLAQRPLPGGTLVVRAAGSPEETAAAIRSTVASLDPRLSKLEVTPVRGRVDRSVARFRGAAWLLGAAAMLAVFLAAVGIYGLLWSFVLHALPEIGIRMALGADRSRITASLIGPVLVLAGVGFLVGSGVGSWGATYLRGYLFGVRPWDVRTMALGVVVAGGLALLTALRPAHRASRLDPMTVLRSE